MMHPSTLKIEDYTYELSDERIAKYPLPQRDASKLLVWKNGIDAEDTYQNISTYIPHGSLMVFNQTRVVHARLLFKKETGSTIEIFCLEPHSQYADIQTAMLQKEKVWWKCLVGGAAKWKNGIVLSLKIEKPAFTLEAKIVEKDTGSFTIEFAWNTDLSFAEVLQYAGKVPLPPYLHREAEQSDEQRYQTIYARNEGSVAAPTAGLHFTDAVMQSLADKHIDTAFVTLHVGAGTFKPVKSETMQEHEMHAEWIEADIPTIEKIITHVDKGVIAVGTTSMRTLESLYWIGAQLWQGITPQLDGIAVHQWLPYELATTATTQEALQAIIAYLQQHQLEKLVTRTQILIAPGYDCKVVMGLITNFHQPQSTLLLLVGALIGSNWRDLYNHALANGYRFLSYGDGCLLLT
jgi:S-adenosylmethionine:tRNA ribosyltransferase-isomerase